MARWQRNLLVALAILAALIVLPGIPWLICELKWGGELRRELAALEAQGVPLSLQDAAPKPIPAERNAATLYLPLFEVNLDPAKPLYTSSGSKHGLSRFETPSTFKAGEWDAAEEMRAVLGTPECQVALAKLREASLRPECVFPVKWDQGAAVLFPHMAQFRQAVRLCSTQALLEAKAGNMAGAVDWLGVCYRMSNHALGEPTIISQLVGYAMLAITAKAVQAVCDVGPVTPEVAAALRAHLDRVPLAERFRQAMIGERAMGLDNFRMINTGQFSPAEIAELSGADAVPANLGSSRIWGSLFRPYWELEELNYLRDMSKQVELRQQPYRLTKQNSGEADMTFGHIMSQMMMPVFAKINGKRDEAQARLDVLKVGLQLKLYRNAHGSYPEQLSDLGPTRPGDVFAGSDLKYRRQGGGFVLYSVGMNLRDDKGVGFQSGTGAGGEGSATDDVVWASDK